MGMPLKGAPATTKTGLEKHQGEKACLSDTISSKEKPLEGNLIIFLLTPFDKNSSNVTMRPGLLS